MKEWMGHQMLIFLFQAQQRFAILDCPQLHTVATRGQKQLRQQYSTHQGQNYWADEGGWLKKKNVRMNGGGGESKQPVVFIFWRPNGRKCVASGIEVRLQEELPGHKVH